MIVIINKTLLPNGTPAPTYVAELTGLHEKYGFDRRFLRGAVSERDGITSASIPTKPGYYEVGDGDPATGRKRHRYFVVSKADWGNDVITTATTHTWVHTALTNQFVSGVLLPDAVPHPPHAPDDTSPFAARPFAARGTQIETAPPPPQADRRFDEARRMLRDMAQAIHDDSYDKEDLMMWVDTALELLTEDVEETADV